MYSKSNFQSRYPFKVDIPVQKLSRYLRSETKSLPNYRRGNKIKKKNCCHCIHNPSITIHTEFRQNRNIFH